VSIKKRPSFKEDLKRKADKGSLSPENLKIIRLVLRRYFE
jgi:hypothetical protein